MKLNILWAPWRIKYILGEKVKGCIFCNAVKSENDEENFVVERLKYCFVILNKYPYNNGHLMIVPYKHTGNFEELDEKILKELMATAQKYVKKLKKVMKADGINIGINIGRIAGAGIENHIHLHIVPRWAGDNNFMPVIGGTKVISESFESVYNKLKRN